MHWADRAAQEIEKEYEEGSISYKEYREQMLDLRRELEDARYEAAYDAYDKYY